MKMLFSRARDIIIEVSELAGEHGITLAIEPLSPVETNFLGSVGKPDVLLPPLTTPPAVCI